jgi:hypothetical protein
MSGNELSEADGPMWNGERDRLLSCVKYPENPIFTIP